MPLTDNKMDTPTITSLVVNNGPPDHRRPKPTPPWRTPFLELLGLLKIIDNSRPTPTVDGQRFCFQPSHDLSEISRIFLSVSTHSSVRYDIDIRTIQLSGSGAVLPIVNKLQEYASHVLQSIQVSILRHSNQVTLSTIATSTSGTVYSHAAS